MSDLSPQEAAAATGLSVHTLRYYERAGLIPRVQRLPNGHRRYRDNDVEWLGLVNCLRGTGMSIQQIRRFSELSAAGEHTVPERVSMLLDHRARILDDLEARQHHLAHVEGKLAYFADVCGCPATDERVAALRAGRR